MFFAKKHSVAAIVLWGLLGAAMPVGAEVQSVVEYAGFGPGPWDDDESFFYTSFPDEIALLDYEVLNDPWPHWFRSDESFKVWSNPESGALPTCRFVMPYFWGAPHFFTPYAEECAAIRAEPDSFWQYEGIAFYLQVPDGNGNCPSGTTILYRLYNRFADGWPVHKLTTNLDTFNEMIASGWWIFEGDARTAAFACVPQ